MKKLLLLLPAFITPTIFTFSQTNIKSSVALVIGPAFPAGAFANTNLYDETSGFAKTGEAISIEYTKPFSKQWSFLINLTGQRNPVNTGAFENSMSKAKIYQGVYFSTDPNNPPPQYNYTIYPNWKFDNKSWLYGTLQVGVKGEFAMGKQNRTWLTTEAAIGVLYASSPQLKGSSTTDTAVALITQSKSTGFGVGYSIGGGVKHYCNRTMFLTAILKYNGSGKVTFNDVKAVFTTTKGTEGSPGYFISQSTNIADGKQAFYSINLMFGIGIIL